MRDIGQHRGKHHCSRMSLTPITFDANTFSCCGGSYFVTIAVFYHPLLKTSELGRATTAHITFIVYFRDHYHWFKVCSFAELSSAFIIPPPRALQSSTSTIQTFSLQSYITRAWGMPASFVHTCILFSHLVEGRIYRFLSSPTDFSIRSHSCSPLQHHSQEKKH
jgi:hypothetical protein